MTVLNTLNPETNLYALAAELLSVKRDENVNESDRISLDRLESFGIHPAYQAALDDCKETGHAGSIKARLSVRLLLAMALANKRNRSRTMTHCEKLAMAFRKGWQYGLTDYAITRDGMTCNGGHSSFAALMAYVPLAVFDWFDICLREAPVKDDEGKVKHDAKGLPLVEMQRYCPAKPAGKYDDESEIDTSAWSDVDLIDCSVEQFEEIAASDDDTKLDWLQRQLELNLTKFGIPESEWFVKVTTMQPNNIVTLFDTLSRDRQGSEQLELFQPSRHYIETTSVFANYKVAQQVLKCCHLRAKVRPSDSATKENGYPSFGTPKGGGNTDAKDFPAFFLSFLEGIKTVETYLDGKGKGSIAELRHDDWKAIPEKDLLVTCIMSKPVAARRLLGAIARGVDHAKTPEALCDLAQRFVKPKKKRAYFQRPTATDIQATLFAIANNTVPDFESDIPIEHQTICRGDDWDCGAYNGDLLPYTADSVGENDTAVLIATGKMVDHYFGDGSEVATKHAAKKKRARRKPAAKK